jgi:hypothetical protein
MGPGVGRDEPEPDAGAEGVGIDVREGAESLEPRGVRQERNRADRWLGDRCAPAGAVFRKAGTDTVRV